MATNELNLTPEVQSLVNKCICNYFGIRTFINNQNELIVYPSLNAYFRLEDVKTELDFKCKVLEWLSFYTADNHGCFYPKKSKKMEKMINYILHTRFTHDDFQHIYCKLGNCVNHDLTVKFVESNYDINILCQKRCWLYETKAIAEQNA